MRQPGSTTRAGMAAACLAAAAGVAEAQATRLAWSSAGPIAGMHCTQVIEGASPLAHTWRDNFLCTSRDIGLRWSSSGPVAGMRCTQIIEGAEPLEHTWRDNYLCLPQDSPVTLSWSSSGPIPGRACVQVHEGRDPYSWHDNYLCWTEELRRADLLTITEIRNIKPASGLDAAGKAVFGIVGAAVAAAGSGGVSLGDLYDGARFGVTVGQYLDRAFSGQDDLIVKIDGRTLLPAQGPYHAMQAGQMIRPNLRASIIGAAQLQLVEWDGGSDNDNLGVLVILGGRDYVARNVVILAPDDEDGSIYLVSYRVEAGKGTAQDVPNAMLCGTNQCNECARLDCAGQPYGDLDRDGDKPDLIRCPAHFTEAGFIEYPQVFENVFLRVCRHMAAR
ncbi:MAG: hypothetical protein KJZ85_17215 [Rhodobacteraceae bacterium]|nr:hypothetical protein [Paracoccaceae bacterium]